MNDTPIKSAIDTTHFIIVSAALFIFSLVTLSWMALTEGFELDTLRLRGVTVEKLYIKWDKRLHVQADRVLLHPEESGTGETDLAQSYDALFSTLKIFNASWIDALSVKRLEAGDASLALAYRPGSDSVIRFDMPFASGTVTMSALSDSIPLHLEAHIHKDDFKADVTVDGMLSPKSKKIDLSAESNATGDMRLKGIFTADAERCEANVYGLQPIRSITALVRALHLHPDTEPWITSRARGGPLHLRTLRTAFAYDRPEDALRNLHAELLFENVAYRFANHPEAFEPVLAPRVLLTFDDLTLGIHPQEATFYGIDGRSTWLNIDFNQPDPVLNLYLDINDRLSEPLHALIESYGIHLPFTQPSGRTETDLTLHVNLQTNRTEARGNFLVRDAVLDFSGLKTAVKRADVHLENSDVTIMRGDASILDGEIRFGVTAAFDAAAPKGDIRFHLIRARLLKEPVWELADFPYTLTYRLAPSGSAIIAPVSHWNFADEPFTLDAFDAPFDFKSLTLQLPQTALTQVDTLKIMLGGALHFDPIETELDCKLLSLSTVGFSNVRPVPFLFQYDRQLRIDAADDSIWSWNGRRVTSSPLHLSLDGDRLSFLPTVLDIQDLLKGRANGYIDLKKRVADIAIGDFHFNNPVLGELFHKEQDFRVYALPEKNATKIFVPSMKMYFSTDGEGWQLDFSDIGTLAQDSMLMREYNISKGRISAESKDGGFPVNFRGEVDYPYAIAVEGDKPVHRYAFHGSVDENQTITTTINDAIMLRIDENVSLHLAGIGLSQPEIIRFYREHRLNDTNDTNRSLAGTGFTLDANDTFIQLDGGRRALADRLTMHYDRQTLDAKLFHGVGGILFQTEKEKFYIYGRDLDDRFMENLLRLSHFKGGALSFYINGTKKAFNGLVRVDKTRIYDYVVLNNLFAFFNTVPALVTFTLPSYAAEGIPIRSAYATLDYRDERMNISGIKVDSDELDFSGEGFLDYGQNRIDMNLSVKTQFGDNLRKIPVVGYILVGSDNSVLTTVHIDGSMSDPQISSAIARDIIVTPFHILKRTFDFPIHYFNKLEAAAPDASPKPKPKKNPHEITSGIPTAK